MQSHTRNKYWFHRLCWRSGWNIGVHPHLTHSLHPQASFHFLVFISLALLFKQVLEVILQRCFSILYLDFPHSIVHHNSAHVFAKNITPIHSVISPDSFVPRPITSSIFHVASTDPFAANMGITISTNKGLSPHTHPYCHLLHYTTTVQSITISEFMWLILSCIITLVSGL